MGDQPRPAQRGRPPHPDILTPREWQVLELLRQNLTNEQIAHRLDISPATAKYDVSEILSKLGVTTREEAAAWEPLSEPERWWQRATAWVPRRAAPVVGTVATFVAVAALAWLVLGESAGENGDVVQIQPSSSLPLGPSSAVKATPQDITFAPLSIPTPEDTKLFFTRGQTGFYEPGALWMSDLDGSQAQPLMDQPAVTEVIAIVPHWQTSNPTLYYTLNERLPTPSPPHVSRGRVTLSALDLVTGERTGVLEFEIEGNQVEGAADVTSDGRYIAYTDHIGVAILDTNTGETRRVLDSDTSAACNPPGETYLGCSTFLHPSWSPGGSLLAMNQVFNEDGEVLVVDVNAEPASVTTIEYEGIYEFEWSPSGNARCAVSAGAFYPVALVIAREPDWRPDAFLTDYRSELTRLPGYPSTGAGGDGMWGCVWLDDETVALMHDVFIEPGQRPKEILVLDVATGEVRSFRDHNEFVTNRSVLAIPNRGLLISQFHHHTEYPDPIGDHTTPEVVDTQTGARAPILAIQDRVGAAIAGAVLGR